MTINNKNPKEGKANTIALTMMEDGTSHTNSNTSSPSEEKNRMEGDRKQYLVADCDDDDVGAASDSQGLLDSEKKNNDDDDDVDTDNDIDEENGIIEEDMPGTIYSLFKLCDTGSTTFFYSIILFITQFTVLTAALLDSVSEDQVNPFGFPPGVPTSVTVAQAAVIPIIVASQANFIDAAVRAVGERVAFDRHHPLHNQYCKWILSTIAQMTVGFGLLILSFVFCMQSTSVFQVLLNIVALFAVANISTLGFVMAQKGFLGFKIWQHSRLVTNTKIKRNFKSPYRLQALYCAVAFAMYVGYAVVVSRQLSGYYNCNAVYMQFSDEIKLDLPYLSGVYRRSNQRRNQRFVHVDETTRETIFIAYCREHKAFGLSPHNGLVSVNSTEGFDPCSFGVLSQQTEEFDLARTGELPWRVQSIRDETLVDAKSFLMQCVDCTSSSCLPNRGYCDSKTNECVCYGQRYGINCQFRPPPPSIAIDANRGSFPPVQSVVNGDYVVIPREFALLTTEGSDGPSLVLAYDRPVYYSTNFEFLMMFAGRRWIVISPWTALSRGAVSPLISRSQELAGTPSDQPTLEDLRIFIISTIKNRALYEVLSAPSVQPFVVSEEVDIGSTIDNGTPLGLHWIGTRIIRGTSGRTSVALDATVVYDPIFVSSTCDEISNQCQNFGVCINGQCQCNLILGFPTHTGSLCEKPLTCLDVQQNYSSILPSGCLGGYSCNDDTQACTCLDEFPESGRFCQFLPCFHPSQELKFPGGGGCANEGICNNVTGDCLCDPQYTGKYCEEKLPTCESAFAVERFGPNGCSGNGECLQNNETETFFCECSEGFEGLNCQSRRVQTCASPTIIELHPPNGCNAGTCNETTLECDCPRDMGIGGLYCELIVNSTLANSTLMPSSGNSTRRRRARQ